MISKRELIDVQLDALFGTSLPDKVQALVDSELLEGKWADGYDLAVNPNGLSQSEGRTLLAILLSQYPDEKIDADALQESVDHNLPQSTFAGMIWIVADDGSFILNDSLRIARYSGSALIWISGRVSLDGIDLVSVDRDSVQGLAFWGESNGPDTPFILDFKSGKMLKGEEIDW
jgi:hypothetical protein